MPTTSAAARPRLWSKPSAARSTTLGCSGGDPRCGFRHGKDMEIWDLAVYTIYIYIFIFIYIYIGIIPSSHISMLIDSYWCKLLQDYLVLVPEIHFLGVVPLLIHQQPHESSKNSVTCWAQSAGSVAQTILESRWWGSDMPTALVFYIFNIVEYLLAWWLIPLSKWVITPVINGISRVNPLIIGVITHLLSGMSHQVGGCWGLATR